MLHVCFFFLCFVLLAGGGVLEYCFELGILTFFLFVRAKTSRHFSGAPVYISFTFDFYVCLLLILLVLSFSKRKKNKQEICFPKWDVEGREGKRGRHSFVNRFVLKTWLCRTTSMVLSRLKNFLWLWGGTRHGGVNHYWNQGGGTDVGTMRSRTCCSF